MWKVGGMADSPIVFQGHADRIEDIQVLMDGSTQPRVLTASRDKSAHVWDPRIGSPDKLAREVVALRTTHARCHGDRCYRQRRIADDCRARRRRHSLAGRQGSIVGWTGKRVRQSLAEMRFFADCSCARAGGLRRESSRSCVIVILSDNKCLYRCIGDTLLLIGDGPDSRPTKFLSGAGQAHRTIVFTRDPNKKASDR